MNPRRHFMALSAALLAATSLAPASAQEWPPKTVTLVVGFAAGGAADGAARIIAKKLQENLGRTVVVESPWGQVRPARSSGMGRRYSSAVQGREMQYDLILLVRNHAMRSTQQFSITLPNEMADAVRAKVASGEYATESEVIRDGLRALLARDHAVEEWLRRDVAAAFDAMKADPSRAVSADRVKARLAAAARKPRARTSNAP